MVYWCGGLLVWCCTSVVVNWCGMAGYGGELVWCGMAMYGVVWYSGAAGGTPPDYFHCLSSPPYRLHARNNNTMVIQILCLCWFTTHSSSSSSYEA